MVGLKVKGNALQWATQDAPRAPGEITILDSPYLCVTGKYDGLLIELAPFV